MGNFFKLVGAFLYSIIHAWLINLVLFAIAYLVIQIFSLSWFWIIAIFFFLWGTIEAFRDMILLLLTIPYAWFSKDNHKAAFLPVVYLVINAIWVAYKIWAGNDIPGAEEHHTQMVMLCLFLTYEILVFTYKSVFTIIGLLSERY